MSQRRKPGRHVHGILLLDKPVGLTSNGVLQRVKHLFIAAKAGHTGSLDPLASGLLPICLGEATKISGYLLDADKSYRAVCKLGVSTDSGDADGKVIATRPLGTLDDERVREVLQRFIGTISQIPPMYSAIKRDGVPLYKLARQGIEVERAAREVRIDSIRLLRFAGDELEIDVACSKGTYIRTLAMDIGTALGCGAHVQQLRRTGVGSLSGLPLHDLAALQARVEQGGPAALDELLLPVDAGLPDWPAVHLSDDASYYLCQGQAVFVPKVAEHGLVRLYHSSQAFLGVGAVLEDGRVAPKRLMNTQ